MLRSTFTTTSKRLRPLRRLASTSAAQPAVRKGGDIGDSFTSISGAESEPLPERFLELKRDLARGKGDKFLNSWHNLLDQLKIENETIASKGPSIIPEVQFSDLERGCKALKSEIHKRGAMVVRGVIPEAEARAYKDEIEAYARKNPQTRGFPKDDPQVYELYWSAPQLKARSHPSFLEVQRHLMSALWSTNPDAQISLQNPLTYADRLRIRKPGDRTFALGPHIDGGSVERWEKEGYGKGGVYDKIFEGDWEDYNPWDAATRVNAVENLYDGMGACSMLRMWQGWLSMSTSGPFEGTLLVNPLVKLSTAYLLLRPFFKPVSTTRGPGFLDPRNWVLVNEAEMNSQLHGASLDHRQELTDELHPHLELKRTMVHIPKIRPGDFVAWHCDSIHAVDFVNAGTGDSSVMYIPVCPVTATNAEYLARQRTTFLDGTPAPDFPGNNEGETNHIGRPTSEDLQTWTNETGRQAFGLEKLVATAGALKGERTAIEKANEILGFST